jgi:hypothetical protein
MKGHGSKFSRKKEEAIAALLTERNTEEAAKTVGIAPNTLLSWMKLPEFQAAYREARRAAFGQSIARLQQAAGAAATTLLKIMVDPSAPASCRLRAADIGSRGQGHRDRGHRGARFGIGAGCGGAKQTLAKG